MSAAIPPALILASSSPYRRELLERLRRPFVVDLPAVDETPAAGEPPRALAMRLARAKARSVAARHRAGLVIGSDQVAACAGEVLNKPGDHATAMAQLARLSGREVTFFSALCVVDAASGREEEACVPVEVRYRALTPAVAAAYLELERPYDCVGSAKVEGLGITLMEEVRSDDPTALIGLPLIRLTTLLARLGYPVWPASGMPT